MEVAKKIKLNYFAVKNAMVDFWLTHKWKVEFSGKVLRQHSGVQDGFQRLSVLVSSICVHCKTPVLFHVFCSPFLLLCCVLFWDSELLLLVHRWLWSYAPLYRLQLAVYTWYWHIFIFPPRAAHTVTLCRMLISVWVTEKINTMTLYVLNNTKD